MATTYAYPYNPNANLSAAFITGETHTITTDPSRTYNWFVPFAAPFFSKGLVLTHVTSGRVLTPGVDFNFGLEYHIFNSTVAFYPVYGAIVIMDSTLIGTFSISYYTLGDRYAINEAKALALVANTAIDPRQTYWESVTDIPSQFPVSDHQHDVSDLTGMADVVASINALTASLTNEGGKWWQALNEHLTDYNDPHHVLDMIPSGGTSIAKATQQQAEEGTDNTAYATSLRVAQYAAANILPTLNNHINATGNVHDLTAADLNLGNVPNYAAATQSDVDNNVTPDSLITTVSIVQYIVNNALQNASLDQYQTSTDVTNAIQSAMGSISNYPIATDELATLGQDAATLMTPRATTLTIDGYQMNTTLGVCVLATEVTAYLAQGSITDTCLDMVNSVVYTYNTNTSAWELNSGVLPTTYLNNGRTYYNRVSGKGFLYRNNALVNVTGNAINNVTVSTSAPPVSTTGYADGYVWYQVV